MSVPSASRSAQEAKSVHFSPPAVTSCSAEPMPVPESLSAAIAARAAAMVASYDSAP